MVTVEELRPDEEPQAPEAGPAEVARAEALVAAGNAAFVEEEYDKAVDSYSSAMGILGLPERNMAELYALRAQANIYQEDYLNAVADANKSIECNPHLGKAYLRKGIACFWLEEYETAKVAFLTGMATAKSPELFRTWIRKCDAEVEDEEDGSEPPPVPAVAPAPAVAKPEAPAAPKASPVIPPLQTAEEPKVSTSSAPAPAADPAPPPAIAATPATVSDASAPIAPSVAAVAAAAPSPDSKYRHQWYQTAQKVTLSVMAKGIKTDRGAVNITPSSLSVHIKAPGSEELEYALDIELSGEVDPSTSKVEFLSTKIEIQLQKAGAGGNWPALERTAAQQAAAAPKDAGPPPYPTSYLPGRKQPKDWDQLEVELNEAEKDEKLEGDAALQKLFRDIYAGADEDTRRAMNKSFVESNGTCLSTNWKDIGAKKVECTPPDGMEVKKYES